MANFIEAQSALSVQFNADTNLVTTPITLVCNRQYEVVDYNINVIAGNSDNDTGNSNNTPRLTIDSYPAGGVLATALGTVATSATAPASVGTWVRPAVSPIAAAADVVTNALIGSAIVIRGNTLRIGAAANGTGVATTIQAQGTLRIFAGNRYSATTSSTAYYANNSASGNSSASVSI